MSDSLNHDVLPDELFRNRIAAALSELNQPESDADIAAALDAIDAEPLGDAAVGRIMQQVQRSIAKTSASPRSSTLRVERLGSESQATGRRLSQVVIVVACAALVAVGLVFQRLDDVERSPLRPGELLSSNDRRPAHRAIPAEQSTTSEIIQRVQLGETLSTGPREKRRVTLLDGSVLSINELSRVTISGERRVKLLAGEVFVEVVPAKSSERFVVETPQRTVTALGTKFVVKTQEQATSVVVTQGQVQVSGVNEIIPAGQELIADLTESKSAELRPAKRSAYVLEWVKDLMATAGSIVVPTSEHAGGTVTVVDPQGQEMKLSLRKFHVDVHIEEGFARTTIDQTYFNHTWQQLEGTFRFPLPADASLSRLAMYVNGKLMEGGMVERDYGRNVFEQIRHTRRDPALLEWVDGSTFQMRVFPLEARQEKRILLSYTQRLPNDYGKSVYRFPAGHSLDGVREWSAHLRVKGAAGTKWYSPSHLLNGRDEQGDLVIDGRDEYAALDRDLIVEISEPEGASPRLSAANRGLTPAGSVDAATWSLCEQDGFRYVMLRLRPELKANVERSQRQWIFLIENSADRNDILAETQQQIAKVLLENAEHSDTFSIIRAGTQAESFRRKPVECSLENVAAAQQFLKEVAPIGALDLEQALRAVPKQVRGKRDVWIVHLGTGIPVLGERDNNTLLRLLPTHARYVGVAVGKRWSKSFMETAANHSGGHVTQINPDEAVAWRAFDLLSTLNAPRLTEIAVRSTSPRSVSVDGTKSVDDANSSAAKRRRNLAGGDNPRSVSVPENQAPEGRRSNSRAESSVAPSGLSDGVTDSSVGSRPRLNSAATSRLTTDATSNGVIERERLKNAAEEPDFLLLTTSLAHGQELAAVARFPKGQALPKSVTITGKLNGKAYSSSSTLRVEPLGSESQATKRLGSESQATAGHLPRTWARLEIDRLVGLGATEHKPQIIELSKAMYVMSPFTSLLVLETEAMYEQFKVDRGRKDHWAMYPAPAEIPVVADQGPSQLSPLDAAKERLKLSQARAKSAQSNYERSVTEKRPAVDLQRLDRLTRAEQAEVRLIKSEIQRIERANAAAANPIRIVWDSVVQRRTAWQLGQLQAARQHWNYWGQNKNLWMDTEWSLKGDRPSNLFPFPGLSADFNDNGVRDRDGIWMPSLNRVWEASDDVLQFTSRYSYTNGLPNGNWLDLELPVLNRSSDKRTFRPLTSFVVSDLDSLLNLNSVGNLSGERMGSLMGLSPNPVTPYYSTLIDGEEFDEERYRRMPTLTSIDDYGLGANIFLKLKGAPMADFTRANFAATRLPGRVNFNSVLRSDVLADLIDGRDEGLRFLPQQNWWWEGDGFTTSNRFDEAGLMLPYRGIQPSFHRPELLRGGWASNGFNTVFEVDSDGDGVRDGNWLDMVPAVVSTNGRPIRLTQRGEGLGYVTNDGYMLPNAFDSWHPTFYGRARIGTLHPLTGVLTDLPSCAPGLQTWSADRLAIVEQAAEAKPTRGEVDAEARRLIEKARSLGWERWRMAALGRPAALKSQISNLKSQTGTAEGGHPTVIADGSGRFVFEREVGEGLREQVIHDGSTLWHLYPEIGLGAKRTLSRFHQSAIQSLIPWYVPAADDLSVEADVKSIGERTIRITRLKDDAPVAELVFAEDGRLSELRVIDITVPGVRRLDAALHSDGISTSDVHKPPQHNSADLSPSTRGNQRLHSKPMEGVVEPPHSRVISKQTFAADGTIRLFDAEDKLIAEAKYERQPIEAPNLVPATKDLVVLPLPYRSAAGVPVSVPVNLQTNAPDFAKLSDDDALLLLASYFAEARPNKLGTFIEQRFTAKGDHRIGLAVLLSSVAPQNPLVANATKQHLDLPLAKFLEQFVGFAMFGNRPGTLDAGPTAGPFLKRICSAYNHYSRWAWNQVATREQSAADLEQDLARTLSFLQECRSVDLAAKLLATAHAEIKNAGRMNAALARQLNDATAAIAEQRGLPAFGRAARIEWLLTIGDDRSVAEAKTLFRTQLAESQSLATLTTTRSAFVKHFKTPDGQTCGPWGELVKEAAQKLDQPERASVRFGHNNHLDEQPDASAFRLIVLARACVSLSEPALAAEIFQLAIKDQDLDSQPRLNLAALTYAKEAQHWELAEASVRRALADARLKQQPQLWRDAAEIAHQLRKFHEWIECLDHAYELEFAALPKTVNLEAFRQDYDRLFGQLDQRAGQLSDAKPAEIVAFARMVQRAAARWRDIDVDDTAACHRTATILTKLGLPTAAWNYWTTPLAETPDRSTVWQTFAAAMHSQQRHVVADRAWSTAFVCEPTNPEILLQHAQFLRSTHQPHKAHELLTKIISSTWQPRFENTKQQAQQLLTGGRSPK